MKLKIIIQLTNKERKIMIKKIFSLISILAISFFSIVNSNAVEKWDMPMAYSATNFHSQNGVMFSVETSPNRLLKSIWHYKNWVAVKSVKPCLV